MKAVSFLFPPLDDLPNRSTNDFTIPQNQL